MLGKRYRKTKPDRQGTAAIEAALLLPVLIFITLGAIDIAQYINLAQLVANASREGGRVASRSDTESVSAVVDAIEDFLANSHFNLTESQITEGLVVEISQGQSESAIQEGDLTTVDSGDQICISVSFDFTVVRWLKGPDYWNQSVNDSKTYCRRE